MFKEMLSGVEFKTSVVATALLSTVVIYLLTMSSIVIYAVVKGTALALPEYIFSSFHFVIGTSIAGVVGNGGVSVLKSKLDSSDQKGGADG